MRKVRDFINGLQKGSNIAFIDLCLGTTLINILSDLFCETDLMKYSLTIMSEESCLKTEVLKLKCYCNIAPNSYMPTT